MWEETFRSHKDSKPKGPEAISLDIAFPAADHVYGLPQHASDFSLKATAGTTRASSASWTCIIAGVRQCAARSAQYSLLCYRPCICSPASCTICCRQEGKCWPLATDTHSVVCISTPWLAAPQETIYLQSLSDSSTWTSSSMRPALLSACMAQSR